MYVSILTFSHLKSLYLPDDLNQLYNWTYALGAYIHSDSSGSSGDFYSTRSYEIDNFQWEHKDFLNVRAVGNDGQSGDRTVMSEANAKNSLVIGASMSTMQAFQDYYTSFVPFDSEKLCVLYGICNVTMSECCALDPLKAQYCCPGYAYNDTLENSYRYNQSNVAYFSSRGPAGILYIYNGHLPYIVDGRVKPDLIAPGYMIASSMANKPGSTSPHSELCNTKSHTFTNIKRPCRRYFVCYAFYRRCYRSHSPILYRWLLCQRHQR